VKPRSELNVIASNLLDVATAPTRFVVLVTTVDERWCHVHAAPPWGDAHDVVNRQWCRDGRCLKRRHEDIAPGVWQV